MRTVVTGIPFYTGHDGSTPTRYFRLGRFTLGNTDGFNPSYGLEYAQQLVYPIPATWELLAYDIRDGASCLFQELVDVPSNKAMHPVDRVPLPVFNSVGAYHNGGSALATLWTYTVPTARLLWLTSFRLQIQRLVVYTGGGGVVAQGYLNGVRIVESLYFGNTVGQTISDELVGTPLLLKSGDVIRADAQNTDVAGTCRITASFAGFLFDS
jgi:hypothetical protein